MNQFKKVIAISLAQVAGVNLPCHEQRQAYYDQVHHVPDTENTSGNAVLTVEVVSAGSYIPDWRVWRW